MPLTIVDCGINNLRSVEKAFQHLGHETQVSRDPRVLAGAEKIVLPGVGAFGAAMKSLESFGLVEALQERVAAAFRCSAFAWRSSFCSIGARNSDFMPGLESCREKSCACRMKKI